MVTVFAIGFAIGVLIGLFVGVVLGARQRAEIVRAVGVVLAPAADARAPACAVCGFPANPVRFHDGRYLCSVHKGAA